MINEDYKLMLELTQRLMLQEPYKSRSFYGEEFNRNWNECEETARWMLGWRARRALWFWEE